MNSIKAAGFDVETSWHIYKHDVYGRAFREVWLSRELIDQPMSDELVFEEAEYENVVVEDYE